MGGHPQSLRSICFPPSAEVAVRNWTDTPGGTTTAETVTCAESVPYELRTTWVNRALMEKNNAECEQREKAVEIRENIGRKYLQYRLRRRRDLAPRRDTRAPT